MAIRDLTSRAAVLAAIREFDSLGRDRFLSEHGFGRALEYFLVYRGRSYNSKAIAGVAHGIQHRELGALGSDDFTGGAHTTVPRLEPLGFEIRGWDDAPGSLSRLSSPVMSCLFTSAALS